MPAFLPSTKRALRALALLAPLALAGCGDRFFFGADGFERTLYVASRTETCYGISEQQCLLVKFDRDDDWEYHYDGIGGFDYERGFEYKLLVRKHLIAHPLADGSSIVYELIRVLSKTPAPQVAQ